MKRRLGYRARYVNRRSFLAGAVHLCMGVVGVALLGCTDADDDDPPAGLTAARTATPAPATAEPTRAPAATSTPTSAPTATATPKPTPAATPEPTPTATPEPMPTATPEPTPTATPESTPTAVRRAASPPPAWIFAGDIPDEHQTVLREEMEHSRAYFSNRFGVEATGFTVLVGSDYEAMAPVYEEMTGVDLAGRYGPFARISYAWVRASRTGGAVVTMMIGRGREALSVLNEYVVHEYFHVLQGQLASGTALASDGDPAYFAGGRSGPRWLMEGLASYADYAYTPTRPGRRPFLDDRYYPYRDISDYQREWGEISLEETTREEDYRSLGCSFGDQYVYAMGFAASLYLLEQAGAGEDSYVRYWSLLGARPTWQQAFEEAFGIGVDDFFRGFSEWLPAQLPPPRVAFRLQFRWAGIDSQHLLTSFLFPRVEAADGRRLYDYLSASTGWYGDSDLPTAVVEYAQDAVGTGYLALWWYDRSDLCTEHLLGWYKDGELTSRREDATPVQFTGRSETIEWSLPGNPDVLPRLEERTKAGCD